MGHYASEIDPKWNAHIEKLDRVLKLQEQIDTIPLGYFRVEDLDALLRLKGLAGPMREISDDDLTQLEQRAIEILAGKVTLNLQ